MHRFGKRAGGLSADPTSRTIIVGAGIAGLTLSLALAQRGQQSLVLEVRAEPTTDGAGIQLGPNATSVLKQIGVLDAVARQASQPATVNVRKVATGQTIARLPLPSARDSGDGAPYLVVHRAVLHTALYEAARLVDEIELRFGCDVRDFDDRASDIRVELADGRSETGQCVIGCDGVWSRVRQHIAPDFHLNYSGMVAARAVIAFEQAPPSRQEPGTGVWLGPETHIVKYPIDAGRNIAMIVVRRDPQRFVGWGNELGCEDLLRSLPRLAADLAGLLKAAQRWRQWALYDPPPLNKWCSNRAIVIGDAAHPVLPFLAQGGGMAIEDAIVLANLMADHGPQAAFPIFEKLRRGRVTRIQQASRQNGKIYHLSGLAATMRDSTMQLLPGSSLMKRYDWIYSWRP